MQRKKLKKTNLKHLTFSKYHLLFFLYSSIVNLRYKDKFEYTNIVIKNKIIFTIPFLRYVELYPELLEAFMKYIIEAISRIKGINKPIIVNIIYDAVDGFSSLYIAVGLPQFGQQFASFENIFPQSLHFIKAINTLQY